MKFLMFILQVSNKLCAFVTLSALLTARNIPLSSPSKVTFKNVLLQGDKLYLKALNTGFFVLDQSTDFLSVEHLYLKLLVFHLYAQTC